MSRKSVHLNLFAIFLSLLILIATLAPQATQSFYLKRKQIKALKKVAVAATVLGQRKKVMIPLPLPLPFPIPIINKHEPIISPIDPLLTITAAKGAKGYYPHYYPGFGGIHGGYGGFVGGRR